MLFCTSLVALVGSGSQAAFSPRRLQITNTKRQSIICELTFPMSILSVKLNRRRLVVLLEEQIYVYDISNMKLHHTIETAPNPSAVFAMSPNGENCYIAYPQPSRQSLDASHTSNAHPKAAGGDIVIFDANSCETITIIQAHKSGISCLAINQSGTLLATASDKGTVIRVFSLPDGAKVAQFRRGTYPAKIYSISFNVTSTLLCVSSDSDTVHIFRLEDGRVRSKSTGNGSTARDGNSSSGRRQSMLGSVGDSDEDDEGEGEWGAGALQSPPAVSYDQQRHPRSPRSAGSNLPESLRNSPVPPVSPPSDSQASRRRGYGLPKSWKGLVNNKLVGKATSLMPGVISEMWEPSRNFAFLKLPRPGVRSLVAMSSTAPQVIVVTSEGFFYVYSIDLDKGGECILLRQFSLQDNSDEHQLMYTSS
ncbi:autophagy protein [Spiromyces aspiralis]|uniref:Autophagy protein n=1 Tax=Spiromyces aspiralis TaxID=68401 RepID=A0ACC1HV72_9FUNG|nr:autophagy protein [Spiromyces aspiralis]